MNLAFFFLVFLEIFKIVVGLMFSKKHFEEFFLIVAMEIFLVKYFVFKDFLGRRPSDFDFLLKLRSLMLHLFGFFN